MGRKNARLGSPVRRSSKVYEPSIDSLCDEALLAEMLQTPTPWTYKDLFANSQNEANANASQDIQLKRTGNGRNNSREVDRSPMPTGRTDRSVATRSSRLASTGRGAVMSSSGSSKGSVSSTQSSSRDKISVGPPPERFVVAHMLKYRQFIADERWWDTHGLDLPLGGNDKRKLMVLRYGMRVPFPVETVFRWFEEIMVALRAQAEKMILNSPWRNWTVNALVILLREHAWSDDGRQKLIQNAQSKGLLSLCILAHRWSLRVVEEREWRPASRAFVVDGKKQALLSGACPPTREGAIDEELKVETSINTNMDPLVAAKPLPYTSGSDWSDLGSEEAVAPVRLNASLSEISRRSFSRANSRMSSDLNRTNSSQIRIVGGNGTGREDVSIPPSSPQIGPLAAAKVDYKRADDMGAKINQFSPSSTATDHLINKMNDRGKTRASFFEERKVSSPFEKYMPQTPSKVNSLAFDAGPHSFEPSSPLSLNNSDSVQLGASTSPIIGSRAGSVGGGYGVGDGGGTGLDGGVDWFIYPKENNNGEGDKSEDIGKSLPFPNFFPTDDLLGEALKARIANQEEESRSRAGSRGRGRGRKSPQSRGGGGSSKNSDNSSESERKNQQQRKSSQNIPQQQEGVGTGTMSSTTIANNQFGWSPQVSPTHTPGGSLAMKLLSSPFTIQEPKDTSQQGQDIDSNSSQQTSLSTQNSPLETRTGSSFDGDGSQVSRRFEPKTLISSSSSIKSLKKSDSVNLDPGSDIEYAPANADRRAVQYLLDACSTGNLDNATEMYKAVGPSCILNWVDGRGRGALHYAAMHGHVEMCNWLLTNGAQAMAKDNDGRVPLHLAALSGHENALRALMNHPAARPKRPDPLDNLKRTPLHLAAWFGQKHTTEALMRNSADVNAKDVQGYTPLERASMARRTALMEFLQRQQILPLDFNTTFQAYHTYDEHAEVDREKLKKINEETKEDLRSKALTEEISARAARSVEMFHMSGVVPNLGPIRTSSSPPPISLRSMDTEEKKKRRRRPAPLPDIASTSAPTHPTAVAGGLDELLTESPNFAFPRAVHLRARRDRAPSSSESDDESTTKDFEDSLAEDAEKNETDSIASDDYDEDGDLVETATSIEEHEVAVVRAGGHEDGVDEISVSIPSSGGSAEMKSAELISKHVNEYLGGPQVAGVGAELKMMFATTSAPQAAFSRGKAKTPGFMHTIASPTVDPCDITGAKARTRLRLLGGKHRSTPLVATTETLEGNEIEGEPLTPSKLVSEEPKTPTSPTSGHTANFIIENLLPPPTHDARSISGSPNSTLPRSSPLLEHQQVL